MFWAPSFAELTEERKCYAYFQLVITAAHTTECFQ